MHCTPQIGPFATGGDGSPGVDCGQEVGVVRTKSHIVVRGLFGLLALAAALAGGWYALEQTSSWALAAFVFLIVSNVIGRGIPDVITDPDKGRRIAFFGLPPALGVCALVGAYWLWETWWLAVTIGFLAYFVGFAVASVALPRIAAEEHADDLSRMGFAGRAGQRSAGDAGFDAPSPAFPDKYTDNRF